MHGFYSWCDMSNTHNIRTWEKMKLGKTPKSKSVIMIVHMLQNCQAIDPSYFPGQSGHGF